MVSHPNSFVPFRGEKVKPWGMEFDQMKITLNRESFLKSLLAVSRAIPSRTTKDVLKNILLIVDAAGISLVATNGEIGMRIDIGPADVAIKGAGRLLLPGRFLDVLREGSGESVEVESSSKGFDVRMMGSTSSEFQLSAMDAGDFPEVLKPFEDPNSFVLSAAEFRTLYRRTSFAVDEASTRYALGGINIEFAAGAVKFCATDSRRLALAAGKVEAKGSPTAPTIAPVVPTKAMKLVDSQADVEKVEVAFQDDKLVRFKIGAVTIQASLIQGRFPDYRKVMPNHSDKIAKFTAAPFLAAVRQAMLIREKEGGSIKFGLRKGFLKFSSEVEKKDPNDMFGGAATVDLPIEYQGENFNAAFDPGFFSDFLKAIEPAAAVEFRLTTPEDPALLETDGFQYVVMPISKE